MEPPSDGTDALEPIEMLQDTSFNSYSPSRPVRRWHWRCVVELCCLGRCCVQDVSGAALTCGGCFWLATCIAAAALSSAGHPQLAIILGLNAAACFGLLALWKRRWGASKYRYNGSWLQRGSCALRDQGLALALQRISTGARIIVGAALSLWLQLFVRLCYAPRFGGDPASFDFGVKCSKEEKGDDGGHWECGQNVSFVFEFNSFGHCLQGCLSVLLFPAVDAVIAHLATSQPSSPASSWAPRLGAGLVLAKDLAAFCVCVYPVYNVIKRAVTHHEDFAASSFCNNGSEWACGFVFGLAAGVALEAEFVHRSSQDSGSNSAPAAASLPASGDQQQQERHQRSRKRASVMWSAAGAALFAASVVSAALYGVSWRRRFSTTAAGNYAFDDDDDDAKANQDIGVLVLMLVIPIVVGGALVFVYVKQGHAAKEAVRAASDELSRQ